MRILSLFSGIGAFEHALSELSIPFDLVNYCEVDAFNIINGERICSGNHPARLAR